MLEPKSIVVSKNGISDVLRYRWIACYMLHDWNPAHAQTAFSYNEIDRVQKVAEIIGDDFTTSELPALLTDTYNRVLAKDVEEFTDTNISVCGLSRSEHELRLSKALSVMLGKTNAQSNQNGE